VVANTRSASKSGSGPTDAALVVAARAGEAWAQQALFERYARMVLGLSQRILCHSADADDLAQDAFVYALNHLDSLQNPQAFAAWIASIVVRTASKRLRTRRLLARLGLRRRQAPDLEAVISPNAPPDVAAELRAVYAVVERLPAEERVALLLRRVEGLEIAETAERMDLSPATVKRRIAAAEARLERARRLL
jgi:RNA polymerase sigma-70 factor (ECF subfamily)